MKKIASGYRLIFGYLGIFLALVGIIILMPLVLLAVPAYHNDVVYIPHFLIPGLAALVGGILLFFLLLGNREKAQLAKHQDSVLLILVWLFAIVISAFPFWLSGKMTFTEAIFESTSGYASVGLTRLPNELFDSHMFTFYRALLQFFGGVGLVLIITSAISDRYGLKLYVAEGHNDKLIPNLSKSARIILSLYVGFIILGSVALIIAGVEPFDAITHSISAVATGGFSSRVNGMAGYSGNQLAIEIITCVLMILGATNFVLHFMLLLGKFKRVGKDIEIKTFGFVCLIFIPLIFIAYLVGYNSLTGTNYSVLESLRYGTFTFISCITTTGYSNVPIGAIIPAGAYLLLTICNVIGGGMGSTAGGIKFYRLGVAVKSYYWTLKERMSPRRLIYPTYITRYGEMKEVTKSEASEAFGYTLLYILVMLVGAFFVSVLGGFDFGASMFEFSTALSGTGLSNGITSNLHISYANIEAPHVAVAWILNVGMFLGRLEILVVYYALFRVARDILRKETI